MVYYEKQQATNKIGFNIISRVIFSSFLDCPSLLPLT